MKSFHSIFSVLIFGFAFFCTQPLLAQPRAMGLIQDDEGYAAAPRMENFGSGSEFGELGFKVDLKPFCPTPSNQGTNGSCVGHAVGYEAFTMSLAIRDNLTSRPEIDRIATSAMYIYNQIKVADCKDGARITDAFTLLSQKGDCLYLEFNPSVCSEEPGGTLHNSAAARKIKSFNTIFEINAPEKDRIYQTKLALSQNYPVIIGMNVTNTFMNLKFGDEYWDASNDNSGYAGGHAMTVVGYNDGGGYFEIMNSWGTSWGNNGFFKMKYKDYAKMVRYGYIMVVSDKGNPKPGNDPNPEPKPLVTLSGSYSFRFPIDFVEDKPIFNNAKVTVNSGIFQTEKTWDVGQVFQLTTINGQKGEYIYVFSFNPQQKTHLHWPSENLGMVIVPMTPYKGTEIVIPNEKSALALESSGSDYLCILYSSREITDLKYKLSTLETASGDFSTRLKTAFGNELIPSSEIEYTVENGDLMKFSCSSSKGSIAPLILKVTAN